MDIIISDQMERFKSYLLSNELVPENKLAYYLLWVDLAHQF